MDSSVFSKYLLPVVIGMIMFNLGLSLSLRDFRKIFTHPKALLIGLSAQMILLPVIAFVIAGISGLPQAVKVGIVIIAACPGGATSNLITYHLKGDVALSISLTSVNSILILFSIPGIVFVALQTFMGRETMVSLPFVQTVLKILFMILLPTGLGLFVRERFPQGAGKLERVLKYITTGLLAVVFLFTILASNNSRDISVDSYLQIAPYALALNVIGMLSGYFSGRLAGFRTNRLITLAVEVGIQNSALAITIASSEVFLGSMQMAVPAVVYGMFTFFNAVLFGYIIRRWMRK